MPKSKAIHALEVLLFFSALYSLFFSPVIFFGKVLAPGDAVIYYLPNFFREKVLWEPLIWCGFPVFADPQAMAWYPLSLIFSFLFHSWNAFVVSAYVLASVFTYGYVYTLTGSRLSGFAGGIIYGMSGFMISHLGHTSIIHGAIWLPLFLWALEMLRQDLSYRWFAVGVLSVGAISETRNSMWSVSGTRSSTCITPCST